MGCDIHAFIEHRKKGDVWWSLSDGEIEFHRYYGMFATMAGVRKYIFASIHTGE